MVPESKGPFIGYVFAGGLFSLSTSLSAIALPWLVYDLSGRASLMGGVAFAALFPVVIGMLFGGRWLNSTGVRKAALIAGWVNLLPMIAIAGLASFGLLSYPVLLALTFLSASFDGIAHIAFEARWPEIARLARISLSRANSLDDIFDNLIAIVGPALAGVLIYVQGVEVVLWTISTISALSLIITYMAFPSFRVNNQPKETLFSGVVYLWRSNSLRSGLILGGVAIAVWSALEMVVIPAMIRSSGQNVDLLSFYLSSVALGAVLINAVLVISGRRCHLGQLYPIAFIGFLSSLFLFLPDPTKLYFCLSGLLCGLSIGPLGPCFYTVLYSVTPKYIRAQVTGTAGALLLSVAPFGVAIAGVALEFLSYQGVLMFAGGILLVCGLFSLFLPRG